MTELNLLDKGYVRLIDHMGSDLSIVEAARTSYFGSSKDEEANAKLLEFLVNRNHQKPFESVELQFECKMPMVVFNHLMTYRTISFNTVSRRRTAKEIEFYIPETWKNADEVKSASWSQVTEKTCEMLLKLYNDMLDDGIVKEEARYILPQNIYVTTKMKMDLRNFLFNLCEQRMQPDVQKITREYVEAMFTLAKETAPTACDLWLTKHNAKN